MNKMSIQEQALHAGLDFWQVVIERPGGPRFVAHEGFSEQEAREEFEEAKSGNVARVQILLNRQLEQDYQKPEGEE